MAMLEKTRVCKVISGGQTGADQGGLTAAKYLGIETGGYAPSGWMTEDGPRPELLESFGLIEDGSYQSRTRKNVAASDATIIFGTLSSPGTRLTIAFCAELGAPIYHVPFPTIKRASYPHIRDHKFNDWLYTNGVSVLNVAGNRESKNPGIFRFSQDYLIFNL